MPQVSPPPDQTVREVPGQSLPRRTPESLGVSSLAALAFVDAAEAASLGLHSLMLLRHGRVAAEGWWEPCGPQHPHMLFSLSKSFAATAAGLAAAEGLLSLDDSVLSFFPGETPAQVGPHLTAMRVRHLLSMSTGHAQDTTGGLRAAADGDWVRAFLAQPVEYAPGTHFVYNSGATYLVSAIVQKVTGMTLLDFLRPRLFDPLGITDPTWESSPQGINVGGWGLSLRTEDIAKFGQLYLQRGVWQGARLLPEAWVSEATAEQVENGADPDSDWAQGYGFQFWRCRHEAYRGDGAFGQFCVVLPDQDAVVAMTAGSGDLGGVLNLVWDHLLPAMGIDPLPDDPAAQARLRDRLGHLSLPVPEGRRSSPLAANVSGQAYAFAPGDPTGETDSRAEAARVEAVTWDFHERGALLTARDRWGEHRLEAGADMWQYGTTAFGTGEARRYAARGAWAAEDTYVMQVCFYETPFCLTLTSRFSAGRLRLGVRQNVSFGPTERPPQEGRAVPPLQGQDAASRGR